MVSEVLIGIVDVEKLTRRSLARGSIQRQTLCMILRSWHWRTGQDEAGFRRGNPPRIGV